MKNKVIQKFFTVLLGLVMVSPGWAATQYCDFAVSATAGDVTISYYNVSGNTYGITIKAVGNLVFTEPYNCNCGVNQSQGAGITLDNSKWNVSATEVTATFTTGTSSVPTTFFANTVCFKKDFNSGKINGELIEINLPNTDVDWTASCSAGPSDDTEAPVMTSASLESKTHNSAVITVEATDNVGVTKYVVYNNTATQGEYAPSDGKITVTGLAQQTAYTLTIKAKDAAGNESENSKEVIFTTDAFVYYKYATGHEGNAAFGDANGRILLTLTKMGTNSINVLVEPNNAGTIVDWAEVSVNGVGGTAGAKSATSTQNIGEIALQNVTLPATGTFPVNITWHTPSLGGDGGWTTFAFQVATSELYVAQGVAVTGVSIPETATVDVNGTQTLTATITPANASNQNVEWEVISGDTYASVDANGVVTGKAVGTAVVQVTTEDGGFTDECTVTVVEPTTTTWWGLGSNNGVDILYSITRNLDKTLTFNIKYYGDKEGLSPNPYLTDDTGEHQASNGTWTSTKKYDSGTINGIIKVEYSGDAAVINYSYTVGAENEEMHLPLRSLTMSETSASMEIGTQKTLTVTAAPADASNSVTWASNAEGVATVVNGVVTAVAEGTATITATSTVDDNITATCAVTVLAKVLTEPDAAPAAPTHPAEKVKAIYSPTYSANCEYGAWGGSVSFEKKDEGIKIVLNPGNGYVGFVNFGTLNCATMEKFHADVWVKDNASMRFVPIITGQAERGVTKQLVGQQWNSIDISLDEGDWVNTTDWTQVIQLKIDEAAGLTFWINNIYFYTTATEMMYAVSATAGDGGSATASAASVASGTEVTFTATPDCGYEFASWTKGGEVIVGAGATYTTPITEETTLTANFISTLTPATPTLDASNVMSVYGHYGNQIGLTVDPWWDYQTTQYNETTIGGETMARYTKINFQGMDFDANRMNVSDMQYVHLDLYASVESDIKFALIWQGGEHSVNRHLNGCAIESFDIPLSEFTNADLTTIRQLKFDAQETTLAGKTLIVQNIYFYKRIILDEEQDNSAIISANNGKVCDVTIARSFTAGSLYTLALPFDMDADQVAETFGSCTMYKLAESYWKVQDENMYIRFAPVTEFEANTPILFTPTTNIENAVANEVTIENDDSETTTDLVTFHGTYSKMNLTESDYILAADQYLYPVIGDDYSINGMRGYFSFGASVPQAPKMARVILHEEIATDNAFVPEAQPTIKKVVENGQFVILREGKRYGILGVEE